MYSDLVEQLTKSLNEKDLILTDLACKPNLSTGLSIFGMCRLENLERSIQALITAREMWTNDSTVQKPNRYITVHIRNKNMAVEPEQLQRHPVLCTVDLDNLTEGLEVLPELS